MIRPTAGRLLCIVTLVFVIAAACGTETPGGIASSPTTAPASSPAPTDGSSGAEASTPTPPSSPSPSTPDETTPGTDPTETPAAVEPTPDTASLTVEVPSQLSVTLTPLIDIDQPLAMATRANHENVFVATKAGLVLELEIDGDEATVVGELLDLRNDVSDGNEQGLLGLTFSPDGDEVYVDFTDRDGATNVVGWAMDGDRVDDSSRRTLLRVDQPASNHNGGDVKFGPDGYLYIGLGDGGAADDEFGNGQDPDTLLATILRIEPTLGDDDAYRVPADNPFVNGGGRPEVFIWGARNPWRFSFDRLTGDLWVGDVGQREIEEVDVMYASAGGGNGANLGWPLVEGTAPFKAEEPPARNYIAPIHDYSHDNGCSVTGGYVYRGSKIPALYGQYVFADLCAGPIRGLATSESQGLLGEYELGARAPGGQVVSFGEDHDGELYVLSFNNKVFRLDPA